MGKTFKPDVLSKKRYKNEGQVESYVLENAFEGIIDKEQFEMVQIELERRDSKERSGDKTFGKFSSKYCFSKIVRCGCCGAFYTRCNNMKHNCERIPSWWCGNVRNKSHKCTQMGIGEEAIKRAYLKVLNELICNYQDIKSVLEATISSVVFDDPTEKISALDNRIDTLQIQMLELHKKKTSGEITEMEYGIQGGKIASKIDEVKLERTNLETSYANATYTSNRVKDILEALSKLKPTEEFDEELFRRLVESITITERNHLKIKFKVGIERDVISDIK